MGSGNRRCGYQVSHQALSRRQDHSRMPPMALCAKMWAGCRDTQGMPGEPLPLRPKGQGREQLSEPRRQNHAERVFLSHLLRPTDVPCAPEDAPIHSPPFLSASLPLFSGPAPCWPKSSVCWGVGEGKQGGHENPLVPAVWTSRRAAEWGEERGGQRRGRGPQTGGPVGFCLECWCLESQLPCLPWLSVLLCPLGR